MDKRIIFRGSKCYGIEWTNEDHSDGAWLLCEDKNGKFKNSFDLKLAQHIKMLVRHEIVKNALFDEKYGFSKQLQLVIYLMRLELYRFDNKCITRILNPLWRRKK